MKRTLNAHEVHVWTVALDSVPPSMESRGECLSSDERTRATLFTAPLEQRRYIASRIVLRHILASYLGVSAAEIRIRREPGGRPFIEGADRLFFNLSHSRETALVAVSGVMVGVDVERARRIARAGSIARRILHPDTFAALRRLPPGPRERAFLYAWTQREAHVKAVGGGLFRTPDVLPFDPRQPDDASVHSIAARHDGSLWSVAHFRPHAGARAAVVTRGALQQIRLVEWQNDTD